MKRILLTLIAGFCFGSVAMAQEPAKAAKKKALNVTLSPASPDYAAKVKAKEAKAKAIESGKPVPVNPAQASKASAAVEKAN